MDNNKNFDFNKSLASGIAVVFFLSLLVILLS
jgi:hypothetical protein